MSTAAEWLCVRLHRLADRAEDVAEWIECRWLR